ncbi:MAG: hypothetical protein KF814_00255 [Nitrospiraceae bacterium]|nr:hypothetical protein [Nitrospiraceae bacterium]
MAQTISVTITVQMEAATPPLKPYNPIDIEAVDIVKTDIKKGDSKDIEVQPASDPKKVKFLMIIRDNYDDLVTYKVEGGSKDVTLDGPQVLLGAGAVGLLERPPTKIKFSNKGTQDVPITIYVGRTAS